MKQQTSGSDRAYRAVGCCRVNIAGCGCRPMIESSTDTISARRTKPKGQLSLRRYEGWLCVFLDQSNDGPK